MTGAAPATVRPDGDELVLIAGDTPLARLRTGPAGPEIRDADGQLLCRLHIPGDGTFDLIGPDGAALVRTRPDPGAPTTTIARDGAGRPVATAQVSGREVLVASLEGLRLASVRGNPSPTLALLLATPTLPATARALVAVYALGARAR